MLKRLAPQFFAAARACSGGQLQQQATRTLAGSSVACSDIRAHRRGMVSVICAAMAPVPSVL
eukprot:1128216-Pelagomonas_calceolata.AAC.5